MKAILDTMAHEAKYRGKTPEKWQRFWNLFNSGQAVLILTEPLVTEVFYRIQMLGGRGDAENYLIVLKGRKNTRVIPEHDEDKLAFEAGQIKLKHKKYELSLVDSYIVAAALTVGATVYTADQGINDAATDEGCEVKFIPKRALVKYIS